MYPPSAPRPAPTPINNPSSSETILLLRQNLDVLSSVLSGEHHRTEITEDERKTALDTLMATAEAGAKLAEAVYVEALTNHHKSGAPGVKELINGGVGGAAAVAEPEKKVDAAAGGPFGGGLGTGGTGGGFGAFGFGGVRGTGGTGGKGGCFGATPG